MGRTSPGQDGACTPSPGWGKHGWERPKKKKRDRRRPPELIESLRRARASLCLLAAGGLRGTRAWKGLISFPLLPPSRAKGLNSTESCFLFAHVQLEGDWACSETSKKMCATLTMMPARTPQTCSITSAHHPLLSWCPDVEGFFQGLLKDTLREGSHPGKPPSS